MKHIFTIEGGRHICKDGRPIAALHGVQSPSHEPYSPADVDALARQVVDALNMLEAQKAGENRGLTV